MDRYMVHPHQINTSRGASHGKSHNTQPMSKEISWDDAFTTHETSMGLEFYTLDGPRDGA